MASTISIEKLILDDYYQIISECGSDERPDAFREIFHHPLYQLD
jgi:hypothetical protein